MSRKLGTGINDNFDNTQMTLNSRLASANDSDVDFFSGDLNKIVALINSVIQLLSSAQVTGLDAQLAAKLSLSGGIMTGALQSAISPVVPTDLTNKAYVDLSANGHVIPACYAQTTVNLNATYNNGTAGVGATLTNAGTLAAFTTDGTTPSATARIFVAFQTNMAQNGVYTLTTVGSGATAWVLTRATDYDAPSEIKPGDQIVVQNGTMYISSTWIQTATVTTVGTDPISFTQTNILNAGTGLTKTGTTISITPTGINPVDYGSRKQMLTTSVNAEGQLTNIVETELFGAGQITGSGDVTLTNPITGFYYINLNNNNSVILASSATADGGYPAGQPLIFYNYGSNTNLIKGSDGTTLLATLLPTEFAIVVAESNLVSNSWVATVVPSLAHILASINANAQLASSAQVTGLNAQLAAKASAATSISAGGQLTGGGDFSANRTLTLSQYNIYQQALIESTAARTLAITDMYAFINCTNNSNTTITIPLNASVAIPIGSFVTLINGTGSSSTLTLSLTGITLIGGNNPVVGPRGWITLQKVGTDLWFLIDVYEYFTLATTFAWGTYNSPSVNVEAIRIKSQVIVNVPQIDLSPGTTKTSAITSNTALPARFRPAQDVSEVKGSVIIAAAISVSRLVVEASSGTLYHQTSTGGSLSGTAATINGYSLGFAV